MLPRGLGPAPHGRGRTAGRWRGTRAQRVLPCPGCHRCWLHWLRRYSPRRRGAQRAPHPNGLSVGMGGGGAQANSLDWGGGGRIHWIGGVDSEATQPRAPVMGLVCRLHPQILWNDVVVQYCPQDSWEVGFSVWGRGGGSMPQRLGGGGGLSKGGSTDRAIGQSAEGPDNSLVVCTEHEANGDVSGPR